MDSDAARLTEHLGLHRGHPFCDCCLAFELKLSLSEVRAARERVASQLDRGPGPCNVCGRDTMTVTARAMPGDSLDARVATFLGTDERRARGVCHACITRHTQIPYADVRKIVTRLRLTELELRVGSCAECARYRMVVRSR